LNEDRLRVWETLFQRALKLIDSVKAAGVQLEYWTFGGGTVLMRRHHHRYSKDIDIFVSDPQWLGYLNPRLNDTAEAMTTNYVEAAGSLKLVFKEGEIDFVAAGPLTGKPWNIERLFDRDVRVETSAEIIGKKVLYRGQHFTARDIFDLAMVAELEPEALFPIQPILRDRKDIILERIRADDASLREAFDALDILDHGRTYDQCVALAGHALEG
jgi:hypothetical protein